MSLGAILGKHDEQDVREGLENVPQKAEGIINRLFGSTLRWLRHQFFAGAETTVPISG
jgi:hypothetical protein